MSQSHLTVQIPSIAEINDMKLRLKCLEERIKVLEMKDVKEKELKEKEKKDVSKSLNVTDAPYAIAYFCMS